MQYLNYFLDVFGKITLRDVVYFVLAIIFLVLIYLKVAEYLKKKITDDTEKENRINELLELTEQYPKWRKQSIDVQKQLTDSIRTLRDEQLRISKKLDEIQESSRKRELSKIRDRLLEAYRYYTSSDRNPQKAWSEMEAEAFWSMFGEYEKAGGNGHMHTEVQPAMRALEEIPMHESDKISVLMQSRR